MAPTRQAAHDKNQGQAIQLGTAMRAARLINPTPCDYNGGLPNVEDLVGGVGGADDAPWSGLQSDPDSGYFVWPIRGGTQQAWGFTLRDADGEQATAIVGGYRPLRRFLEAQNGRDDRVQWLVHLSAELTITAGTEAGVANGLIDTSDFWADTITIGTAYHPQPDPPRLWGPKDATDALSPNNTQVYFIDDLRGCQYAFAYVNRTTAASIKLLEFSF